MTRPSEFRMPLMISKYTGDALVPPTPDIFSCLRSRLKSGWSSMVLLQRNENPWVGAQASFLKEWALSLHPRAFSASVPHPVIIPYFGGIGEQVGRLII